MKYQTLFSVKNRKQNLKWFLRLFIVRKLKYKPLMCNFRIQTPPTFSGRFDKQNYFLNYF